MWASKLIDAPCLSENHSLAGWMIHIIYYTYHNVIAWNLAEPTRECSRVYALRPTKYTKSLRIGHYTLSSCEKQIINLFQTLMYHFFTINLKMSLYHLIRLIFSIDLVIKCSNIHQVLGSCAFNSCVFHLPTS